MKKQTALDTRISKAVTPSLRHRIVVKSTILRAAEKTNIAQDFVKYTLKHVASGLRGRTGGRNNSGKITVRHRDGKAAHKRILRPLQGTKQTQLSRSGHTCTRRSHGETHQRIYTLGTGSSISKFSREGRGPGRGHETTLKSKTLIPENSAPFKFIRFEYNPHTSGYIALCKPLVSLDNYKYSAPSDPHSPGTLCEKLLKVPKAGQADRFVTTSGEGKDNVHSHKYLNPIMTSGNHTQASVDTASTKGALAVGTAVALGPNQGFGVRNRGSAAGFYYLAPHLPTGPRSGRIEGIARSGMIEGRGFGPRPNGSQATRPTGDGLSPAVKGDFADPILDTLWELRAAEANVTPLYDKLANFRRMLGLAPLRPPTSSPYLVDLAPEKGISPAADTKLPRSQWPAHERDVPTTPAGAGPSGLYIPFSDPIRSGDNGPNQGFVVRDLGTLGKGQEDESGGSTALPTPATDVATTTTGQRPRASPGEKGPSVLDTRHSIPEDRGRSYRIEGDPIGTRPSILDPQFFRIEDDQIGSGAIQSDRGGLEGELRVAVGLGVLSESRAASAGLRRDSLKNISGAASSQPSHHASQPGQTAFVASAPARSAATAEASSQSVAHLLPRSPSPRGSHVGEVDRLPTHGLADSSPTSTSSVQAGRAPGRSLIGNATIYNLETKPGQGGQIARAAGTYCTLIKSFIDPKTGNHKSVVKLPSKALITISSDCMAFPGTVSNPAFNSRVLGKAGASRWSGVRPTVRGEAMNPIDHPHGGKSHGSGGKGNPAKTK